MGKKATLKQQANPAQKLSMLLQKAFIKAYVAHNGAALEQKPDWKESGVHDLGSKAGWLQVAEAMLELGVQLPAE